jgi:hypothetical protein
LSRGNGAGAFDANINLAESVATKVMSSARRRRYPDEVVILQVTLVDAVWRANDVRRSISAEVPLSHLSGYTSATGCIFRK